MNKIQIESQIFEYTDFLSDDGINFFINKIKNYQGWPEFNPEDFWADKRWENPDDEIKEKLLEIENKASFLLNKKYKISIPCIHRMYDGIGMSPHHDNSHVPNIRYGFVLYLNDDFDGGELEYTKLNISFKPKAGSLVLHPADEQYEHKVNQVKGNTRYTILFFAHEEEN